MKYWTMYLLVALVCIVSTMVIMDKCYVPKDGYYTEKEYKELVNEIDSLSSHINEINASEDSLISSIDTAKTKVVVIEKEYEEDYIDVTNQSIGDDIKFFTEYLSKSNPGLSGSDYSSTTKEN